MAHGLILGMSESGKTTLAKHLSHALSASGKNVIVLDPMNDPGWSADYKTNNPEEFLEVFWSNQSCYCFIDESAQMVGRYDVLMQETATRGRHHGHSVFFVSQRGAQISATVRAQCRHLYLFCSAKDDCKILANEFNQQTLLNANSLKQFHFYHASRFGGCEIQKLEDPRNVRPVQSVSQSNEKSNGGGHSAPSPTSGTGTASEPARPPVRDDGPAR
jgi:energy-coupling factor transporter ATP-binding protein EcfA2